MPEPRLLAAALAAAMLLAGGASAHSYKVGTLEIDHPHATETQGKTGAGYLAITNDGAEPDRLLEVRTDLPRTQIHTTEIDAGGVARMHELQGVDIPAGQTVSLEPGGTHVMFMGLDHPLAAGSEIDATLVFEKAGELAVVFKVEPRGAGDSNSMSHDSMPGMTH